MHIRLSICAEYGASLNFTHHSIILLWYSCCTQKYVYCIFSIYILLSCVAAIMNKSHWNITINETLNSSRNNNFDAVHVLIINLLHNITNIYLCGGDILGNISDLASAFTITLNLFAWGLLGSFWLAFILTWVVMYWCGGRIFNARSIQKLWVGGSGVVVDMIGLVVGRREGGVHLWDKAEVLQWYIHHSKLHSANKEKTNNERRTPWW